MAYEQSADKRTMPQAKGYGFQHDGQKAVL